MSKRSLPNNGNNQYEYAPPTKLFAANVGMSGHTNNKSNNNIFGVAQLRAQRESAPVRAPVPASLYVRPPIEEPAQVEYYNGPVSGSPVRIQREVEPTRFNRENSTFKFEKCMKIADKWYYLVRPGGVNLTNNTKRRLPTPVQYDTIYEMLGNPGVYTWVLTLGATRDTDRFMARKAVTPGEILSKHKNIFRNLRTEFVVLAGEALVGEGRTVTYNFISGTYMPRIQETYRMTPSKLSNYMTRLFREAGASSITFDNRVNLNSSLIPLNTTLEAIQPYLNLGYTQSPAFDTFAECQAVHPNTRNGGGKKSDRKTRRKTRGRH